MANSGNNHFFLKQLNPGLTQTGKIVFDVPADEFVNRDTAYGCISGRRSTEI